MNDDGNNPLGVNATEAFKEILGQAAQSQTQFQGGPFNAQHQDPLTMLKEEVNQMGQYMMYFQQGMMEATQQYQQMAMIVDLCRFHMQLLSNLLIESGAISEEDFKARYKEEVLDALGELYKKAEEARQQATGNACGGCNPEESGGCGGACEVVTDQEIEQLQPEEEQELEQELVKEDHAFMTDEPILASERAAIVDAEKKEEKE